MANCELRVAGGELGESDGGEDGKAEHEHDAVAAGVAIATEEGQATDNGKGRGDRRILPQPAHMGTQGEQKEEQAIEQPEADKLALL